MYTFEYATVRLQDGTLVEGIIFEQDAKFSRMQLWAVDDELERKPFFIRIAHCEVATVRVAV